MTMQRTRCLVGLSCRIARAIKSLPCCGIRRRLHSAATDNNDAGKIIDVTTLADEMRATVRAYTDGRFVKLMGILADDCHDDAQVYSERIADTCLEDGIEYEHLSVRRESFHMEQAIRHANSREDVHGVLVYYPIFKNQLSRGPYKNQLTGVYYKSHDDYLRDLVCPTKDVEGLSHDYNAQWLFRGVHDENVVFPCTALSVLRILETYHLTTEDWSNTVVTVVNRSEILGRPLAAMLANAGATVYSVDADSILLFRPGGRRMRRCTNKSLEYCLQQSSVVVSGVPSPDFELSCQHIVPGTTIVNVSEYPNVDEKSLLSVPGIQYIPHVGKVTIAVLEQNLIDLYRRHSN